MPFYSLFVGRGRGGNARNSQLKSDKTKDKCEGLRMSEDAEKSIAIRKKSYFTTFVCDKNKHKFYRSLLKQSGREGEIKQKRRYNKTT